MLEKSEKIINDRYAGQVYERKIKVKKHIVRISLWQNDRKYNNERQLTSSNQTRFRKLAY